MPKFENSEMEAFSKAWAKKNLRKEAKITPKEPENEPKKPLFEGLKEDIGVMFREAIDKYQEDRKKKTPK